MARRLMRGNGSSPDRDDVSVLFLSSNFPPEVNALANRTWEHAREWAREGGRISVVTGPPHFPEGTVYAGYRNALTRETIDGVDVLRVPMYIAANAGFLRRTLSYLSYMASAAWFAGRAPGHPEIVVASSPQFFAGLAGWLVARRLRRPFLLEVRDLWPESIVDVGAMRRGLLVRALERLETFLYRAADHIVIVSPAFRQHIEARGVEPERITVLPNGVDPEWFESGAPTGELDALRAEFGLEDRFVASYIGTVGMAHGATVVLEAAQRCADTGVAWVVVGAGAEWDALRDRAEASALDNFWLVEKQSRHRTRLFYALSDVSIVHLLDRPAFQKVIPSKLFECMGMRRPVVLAVPGQATEILDRASGGISVAPEDPDALLAAVLRLKEDPALRRRLGDAGAEYVRENNDRRVIARRYLEVLQRVASAT
ncbi:MAG: glycosyltransferase family 4 protein [Gemmatimonadota bacterium]